MNDVLPGAPDPALPVSSTAVVGGVLAAYGAFAILISIVAGFANGAHSHQVLSGATWKQLGTGGGIVAGIVLFIAWGAGGFFAARLAGREGVRHGVWVFVAGVVLITVVGAAITWLPDTTAILRNLRLLGLPVRRNEWRDFGTVAGLASLIGMAAGSVAGGWLARRERTPVPARAPIAAPAPSAAPPSAPPEPVRTEEVPEPAFVGPSLFDENRTTAGAETAQPPEAVEPVVTEPEQTPAWLQYVQERERAFQERERESAPAPDEPTAAPEPWASPEPWTTPEPAPTFIREPEQDEPERAPSYDDAWALPDGGGAAGDIDTPEDAAFPHSPPVPVPEPEPEPEAVVVPPLTEHDDWRGDDEPFRAPPEPTHEDALQYEPEAPPPVPDIDAEEREARRRQQEEAARAYEQAREQQAREDQAREDQ